LSDSRKTDRLEWANSDFDSVWGGFLADD
jgi:hypothetical protein